MGYIIENIEKYGRAVESNEMPLQEAVTALVAASNGGLAPLGAADLLVNWRTARSEYAEAICGVPPVGPGEHLAFAKKADEQSRAEIADLDFAMKNGIIPARLPG